MRRLILLTICLGAASLPACRTTDNDPATGPSTVKAEDSEPASPPPPTTEAPGAAAPQSPSEPAPPATAVECPVPDTVCSTELSPVACSALMYQGRSLSEDGMIAAWGSNLCQGRLALAREACRHDLRPSQLGRVQCVPDSSNGHCPVVPGVCTREFAPSSCEAETYGDQSLKAEQILRALGSNVCVARMQLQRIACRRNLDPKLLGKIHCEADATNGECAVVETPCADLPRPTRCSAQRIADQHLDKALEVHGPSLCEAKRALARQACKLGLKPSGLDNVSCQAEK